MPKPATIVAHDYAGTKYVVPLTNVAGIYADPDNERQTFVRLRSPIGSLSGLFIHAPLAEVERRLGSFDAGR